MRNFLDESNGTGNGKLAELLNQKERLEARIAKAVAVGKEKSRKLDTRHKIIVGACLLADAEQHPEVRAFMEESLRRAAKDRDKELLRSMGWGL